MVDQCREGKSNSTAIECRCKAFPSIDDICDTLASEERTTVLIEWLSSDVPENGKYLSCQPPSQRNLRCTNRVRASFSVLDAIREGCRDFLAGHSTVTKPPSICPMPSKPKSSPPIAVNYEDSFPSLSATSQVAPNMLVGRRKPKIKPIVTPLVRGQNGSQKQTRRLKPSPGTQMSTAGNIAELPSEDPITLSIATRSVSSVVTGASTPKTHPTTNAILTGSSSRESPNAVHSARSTVWGASTPSKSKNVALAQPLPLPVTISPVATIPKKETAFQPESTAFHHEEVPILLDHLDRLARVYVALIRNLLVPSTAMELHLLVRLLAAPPVQNVQLNALKETALRHLFVSPAACHVFAISTINGLTTMLCNLPVPLVTALLHYPPLREHLPNLIPALTLTQETSAELDIGVGPHSMPMLSLPFVQHRDSRHNFKTKEAQQMFNNREESRDSFIYQLRFFQNTRGKIMDSSELNASILKVKTASKNVIQGIHKLNMSWFAELFCELLLQVGLVPMEETDVDLLSITDTDKLQKLHKRFSSKVGNSKSGGNVNFGQNEDDGTSSPSDEAQQGFQGHQEFFFLFIQSTDSYSFCVHLKSRLTMIITDMASSFSSKGISAKLLKMQLLSKFLGLVVFYPNWGAATEIHALSVDEMRSWLATTDPCLPFLEIIKSSWAKRQVLTVVPWVVEYLRMAKWDKISLHRSPSLYAILATLRTIHLVIQSEPESPNSLFISTFLEILFGDIYGLGRTCYLPTVELTRLGGDDVDDDALDIRPLSLNSELTMTSNPHLEELLSLLVRFSQTLTQSGISRKLRPSKVLPDTVKLMSDEDTGTEASNLDYAITSVSSCLSFTPVTTNASNPSITSKLVDAFFHQHRELKDICEVVVDRAAKNASTLALNNYIIPYLKREIVVDFEDGVLGHLLNNLTNEAVKASLGVTQKILEDTVRGSLDLLSPVGTVEAVRNMAASLCIAHGLKLVEATLISSAAIEAKRLLDDALRQKKKTDHASPSK